MNFVIPMWGGVCEHVGLWRSPPPSQKNLASPLSQNPGSASVSQIWLYLHHPKLALPVRRSPLLNKSGTTFVTCSWLRLHYRRLTPPPTQKAWSTYVTNIWFCLSSKKKHTESQLCLRHKNDFMPVNVLLKA